MIYLKRDVTSNLRSKFHHLAADNTDLNGSIVLRGFVGFLVCNCKTGQE